MILNSFQKYLKSVTQLAQLNAKPAVSLQKHEIMRQCLGKQSFYQPYSNLFSTTPKDEKTDASKSTLDGFKRIFNITPTTLDLQRKHFIVIGDTGSGKSSFINQITQRDDCQVSSQPQSVTHACQWVETTLPKLDKTVFIDTPGFGDTRPEMNDGDILDVIMSEILDLHDKSELGFILCHSVRNTRSHAEIIFENFASTMGPEILKSTMVVLTSANLLKFDALSREIHENFTKFLTEKYSLKRECIVDFDSVDHLPNQNENVLKVLKSLSPYDWKQIEFLKEENQLMFRQIQEKEKIEVEVMIPTPVQVEEPGIFRRYYEEEFFHEENKSQWHGWNYILLGIPYLIKLDDIKMFTCRIPLKDTAYDFRIINLEAEAVEGDYSHAEADVVEKPDRLELQSKLEFTFARKHSAKVK